MSTVGTTPAAGRNRRWATAAGLAAGVGAAVFLLFRGPVGSMPGRGPENGGGRGGPPVQIARPSRSDLELKEEAFIRDLRPLFLPTPLNAVPPEPRMTEGRTPIELESSRAAGGELDFNLLRELPAAASFGDVPAHLAGTRDWISADTPGPMLAGLGRAPAPLAAMAPRGGFLEVRAAGTGETVLAEGIPADGKPPGGKTWQPMELLATVDSAGLLAPLVVVESSRVEEVDAHFRTYLAGGFRLGHRLPPGFYRIVVGP